MSDRDADRSQGAVAGSSGIDRSGNDAAVAHVLGGAGRAREDTARSRNVPHVDPVTGEVSGPGSGAGGGNQGEDHDDDHTAGSNTLK